MYEMVVFFAGVVAVIFALLIVARFVGFSAQHPRNYVGKGPIFDVRSHLNGPMICEGVMYGPFGRVSTRFVAKMNGNWDGNKGRLREEFSFDSGTKQQREWYLTVTHDGTVEARADDVIGVGQGLQMGSVLRLNYRLKLAQGAGGHVLDVTDWIYLLENGTLVNRSQMRKFGIKVAELVATIRRVEA
jgi:hypothetical protein